MHNEARLSTWDFDESIESSDPFASLLDVDLDQVPTAAAPDACVWILLCPGPRFAGARATQFVHSASPTCQARPFVVLDMSEVTAVDAPGLLAITSLARICRSVGGVLRLCSPNPVVRGLLATIGMNRLVDVFHTRRHAGVV